MSRGEALKNPKVKRAIVNYDIEAMKRGIEKAKKNIATFETAIEGENNTIKEYRRIIIELETK
ncbi:MAG: hypothetical protein U9O94_05095 [Nanoarchaeota archaeon]|nr:hypothetical protein [Nanoarchaeota archaeon]